MRLDVYHRKTAVLRYKDAAQNDWPVDRATEVPVIAAACKTTVALRVRALGYVDESA